MKNNTTLKLLLLFAVLLLSTSVSFAQSKKTKTRTSTPTKTLVVDTIKIDYSQRKAPVAPFIDTLFYVYGNSGAITPQQRAQSIEENIVMLKEDPMFNADSLEIKVESGTYLITYSGRIIVGINDIQSEVLQKPKDELAHEYLDIITHAIDKEIARTSWKSILKIVMLSLFILVITFLALKYLNRGLHRLKIFVRKQEAYTIDKIKFILDANKQIGIVLFLIRILRFLLIITVLYFCLYAFLSLFPETKWISNTLIGYVISPLRGAYRAVIDFIPDLFTIVVIIFLFRFLIKGVKVVTDRITDGSITLSGFYPDWAEPTFNIVKVILYVFMIILIFPHLPGSSSPAFQGVSVFLGILFSLGSTSIIANVVSGIVITYMRPFKLGDRIRMGEFVGNVIEKTPLVTRLKTPKNEVITIPNGTIMSAQTINYTNSAEAYGLVLYATVAMGYDIPWRKVHELLIEAGVNTPKVLTDPKPFVLQLALDDFYVQYQINIYIKDADAMSGIYSDLYKNIQDVFHREGIELLSPHFMAQRDGSTLNMPKEYVKPGFERVSPFNMQVRVTKAEDNNA